MFMLLNFLHFIAKRKGEKYAFSILSALKNEKIPEAEAEFFIKEYFTEDYELWQKHIDEVNKALNKHSKTLMHSDADIDL